MAFAILLLFYLSIIICLALLRFRHSFSYGGQESYGGLRS